MSQVPFIGRTSELEQLKNLQGKKTASLVIVQGRRRIGKSRLIQEFVKNQKFYNFSGIAPVKDMTAQAQRNEFTRQLGEQLGIPGLIMEDWGDIFTLLAKQTEKDRIVILFDEISWMGSKDPSFLGKLKHAWDVQFSSNPKLMLVLCGSVSSWIEKNIISSTAFLGRPSLYIQLEELSLEECNEFWGQYKDQVSEYEKLKILSITGGVPRYLELIDPRLSAEENIKNLCFLRNSPLLNEFERIFSDVFGSRSEIYKKIIVYLMKGSATQTDIWQHCRRTKSGDFSDYLNDLVVGGFVTREYTWHLKTGKVSKFSRYRLKDNYTRFYLKYISQNKIKIEKGLFKECSLSSLPGWDVTLSLQFENLVLNNQNKVIQLLGIPFEKIVFANPYFQCQTKTQKGCQIDYLIQTHYNTNYIVEIKFSRTKIGSSIVQEVQQKIDRISFPSNYTYRPVLIHVNGIQEKVIEQDFFARIINFGDLLQKRA